MSDIEYSVIKSDIIKSFDCNNPALTAEPMITFSCTPDQDFGCFYPHEKILSHIPQYQPVGKIFQTATHWQTSDVIFTLIK